MLNEPKRNRMDTNMYDLSTAHWQKKKKNNKIATIKCDRISNIQHILQQKIHQLRMFH